VRRWLPTSIVILNLVLVEGASSGINAILRSVDFDAYGSAEEPPIVLMLSTAYAMVPFTVDFLKKHVGERFVPLVVMVDFPLSSEQAIVDAVRAALDKYGHRGVMAVFSHIASVPPVILPVERLAALCREKGNINVVIDGAHALGQIPFDLSDLADKGVDFYVANAHKWLYGPKGTAIFFVRRSKHDTVRPTVISSDYKDDFQGSFEYTGTRDYTAFCALDACLDFRKRFGDAEIMAYLKKLADEGGQLLAKNWQTELAAPPEMSAAMATVRLPVSEWAVAERLQRDLFERYQTYVVCFATPLPLRFVTIPREDVIVFASDGRELPPDVDPTEGSKRMFWMRLSAQIYLELSDFQLLGDRVLELLREYAKEMDAATEADARRVSDTVRIGA